MNVLRVHSKKFGIGGLAAVLLCVIAWTMLRCPVSIQSTPFDREQWISGGTGSAGQAAVRFRMIGDLVEHYLVREDRYVLVDLLGASLTREQMQPVVAIADTDRPWLYSKYDWDLLYWVGPEPARLVNE